MSTTILNRLGIAAAQLAARGLVAYEEASELVLVEVAADGREHHLTPNAAAAWRAMKQAARDEGVSLILLSSFRSVARQAEIIETKLASGVLIEDVLRSVAPPGYSEHHTGRAVDIGEPSQLTLEAAFATTPAYEWLIARGPSFGFTLSYPKDNLSGYEYEPWHWCYQPGSS